MTSPNTARDVFGVVCATDGTPDEDATRALRASRSGPDREPLALVSPPGPGAGRWAQSEMRDDDVYLLNPTL